MTRARPLGLLSEPRAYSLAASRFLEGMSPVSSSLPVDELSQPDHIRRQRRMIAEKRLRNFIGKKIVSADSWKIEKSTETMYKKSAGNFCSKIRQKFFHLHFERQSA
jgi:hypothetical protein